MYVNWRSICGTLTLAASLSVLGCGTTNNAYVRTVNASPGLTGYSVQVGLIDIASSLPYGTVGIQPPGQYASVDSNGNYRPVGAGSSQKIVVFQKPGTNLASTTQTLVKNSYYTIVDLGTFPNISLLALTDNDTAPTSSGVKLRVVQSSASAGPVDIYLTAPGGSISGASPIVSNLVFGQVTQNYLQLSAGSFEFQITPHGNPSNVLVKKAFSPTSGNIYTAFPLDPAPGSTTFGLLVTHDPVVNTTNTASTTGV